MKYPINLYKESYIYPNSKIAVITGNTIRDAETDKKLCVSEEEAEAFLALMQLRQLRKAYVGDWKITQGQYSACIINKESDGLAVVDGYSISTRIMQFPNTQMASEFLVCFKDLLEKAKVLL